MRVTLGTLLVVLAASLPAGPALAHYTGTTSGMTATFSGDAAADELRIDAQAGQLRHNRFAAGDAGFNSAMDFNSGIPGDQTLPPSSATKVVVNEGGGADRFVTGVDGPAMEVDGQGGEDAFVVLEGATLGPDGSLEGGIDRDRLDYSASLGPVTAALARIATNALSGAQMVPSTASTATGSIRVEVAAQMYAELSASGLGSNASSVFIHGPAPVGANAPLLFSLSGSCAGLGTPAVTCPGAAFAVTASQRDDFAANLWYAVVRSAGAPSGEIRTQIVPAPFAAPGVKDVSGIEALVGGAGGDTLRGSSLDETLEGGPGADGLDAGAGADTVLVAGDGSVDTVACGAGDDSVEADADDTVAADCEHVARPVASPPSPTPPPIGPAATPSPPPAATVAPDTTPPKLTISVARRGRRATLLKGRFAIRATVDEPVRLTARLELPRGSRTPLRLSRATASLPAAGVKKLTFKLSKAVRRTVRRRPALKAVVRLTATDTAGNAATAAPRRVRLVARGRTRGPA